MLNNFSTPRVFVGTEVYFAAGDSYTDFIREQTKRFFLSALRKDFIIVANTKTVKVLDDSRGSASRCWKRLQEEVKILQLDSQTKLLSKVYVEAGLIPKDGYTTAVQLASATLGKCDYFVTWDFDYVLNILKQKNILNVM